MIQNRRELYASSNGDHWFLGRNAMGEVAVIHEPSTASGGRISTMLIGTFLTPSNQGPEHQALRALIGTLIEPRSGPESASVLTASRSATKIVTRPSR
jgi:hypothetical protein